jgi:cobalt-zinc-cadmium efflux system protein
MSDHAHMRKRGHAHHAHDYSHGVSRDADKRYLSIALGLLIGFMAAEVVVGILASSLALISDAGHMLTDAGAIGLSLFAMRMADRPPGGRFTFGFKRIEILSAQINGAVLLLLALWFIAEAAERLIAPPHVQGALVLWVALAGIVINLLAASAMRKANRQSLNVEGSFQHIVTDLYAFIATAVAGALIWWSGYDRIDAVAALIVAALMVRAGVHLIRASGRVFLEAAPASLDPNEIGKALAIDRDVVEVHDLHVWEVTSGFAALSAHVLVADDEACHGQCHRIRSRLERVLEETFDIHHSTLQVEHYRRVTRLPAQTVVETLPSRQSAESAQSEGKAAAD